MTALQQLAQAIERMIHEYVPEPAVDEFLRHCIVVLTGLVQGVEPDGKDGG